MGAYLNTLGRSTLAIGICDRCKRKFSLDDLYRDPNSPGLRVCMADKDDFDPYRLPARQPEKITLAFVRPDADIATNPAGVITQNEDQFIITEDDNGYLIP